MLFSDIDFDKGSENPFALDIGTHQTTISDAVVERAKTGTLGLWVTFSADDGKSARKWVTMPEKSQDEETYSRNVSFLRMFLRSLELPEEKWGDIDRDDLVGLDCIITITPQKKNPDYTQVGRVTRAKGTPMRTINLDSDGMNEFKKPVPSDGGFKFSS